MGPFRVRCRRPRWTRPGSSPQQWLHLIAYWCASRLVILALLRQGRGDIAIEVHDLYHHWSHVLAGGTFPIGDVTWQYPPGAALVMVAPALVPVLSYLQAFVLLMFIADAVTLLALLRAGTGRPGRSTYGAWFWALGLPLMLHLSYARYDVLVTAIAVLGLVAMPNRPLLGGVLAGLGAVIKIWPALIVLGTPRGRTTRRAWTAMLASATVIFLLLASTLRGALDFLTSQHHRGVEIESLGGTALNLARLLGWPGRVEVRYGSMEYLGPYVSSVARLSVALTALSFAWLLLWRLRARRWTSATPYDSALTAVLLFTVTSRVISPQYLVWLIGLGAVCLTVRHTTQRPVAIMLLLAAAVTTVDFPLFFGAVINSSWQGFAVLALRNGLLAVATFLSCARLWRAARQGSEPAARRAPPRHHSCRRTRRRPTAPPTSNAAAHQPPAGPPH
jgi:hypothetical protein